jgi:hypothetical protein
MYIQSMYILGVRTVHTLVTFSLVWKNRGAVNKPLQNVRTQDDLVERRDERSL